MTSLAALRSDVEACGYPRAGQSVPGRLCHGGHGDVAMTDMVVTDVVVDGIDVSA